MKGYQALPEERCGNCKYFYKHYIRTSRGHYHATDFGHCVHPRLKNRRVEECCPHFSPSDTAKAQKEAPAPENPQI